MHEQLKKLLKIQSKLEQAQESVKQVKKEKEWFLTELTIDEISDWTYEELNKLVTIYGHSDTTIFVEIKKTITK